MHEVFWVGSRCGGSALLAIVEYVDHGVRGLPQGMADVRRGPPVAGVAKEHQAHPGRRDAEPVPDVRGPGVLGSAGA